MILFINNEGNDARQAEIMDQLTREKTANNEGKKRRNKARN